MQGFLLGKYLASDDYAVEIVRVQIVAEAILIGEFYRAPTGDINRRRSDIPLPITFTGRDIPGKNEVRQSRERNVMRPADTRFEHSPAPNRNARGHAKVVDLLSRTESAYAPQFYIDNPACLKANGLLSMMRSANTFIQTDRRL